MRLLLDTHTMLWLVSGDSRLSPVATKVLIDPNNALLISPATYWELAIKVSQGKYHLVDRLGDYIEEAVRLYGLTILPITARHAEAILQLPYHHKDPFDRMLIAQSLVEGISLVSADEAFDSYPVKRIW